MLFRGILFRWIEEFGGSWVALLLTSAASSAPRISCNPNATWVLAAVGFVEGGRDARRRLHADAQPVAADGLHAAWNFTQGEVFDIPVSGMIPRPGRSASVGRAAATGAELRARGVADRHGRRDGGRGGPGRAGCALRLAMNKGELVRCG